ncbi:hypothetical protein GXP67_06265 [Rhodocytophaga rosea]|uniref:Uncharacterized protein n=1 Tax=Rhodocytophaga rosea TaxID=2704465 RepID=A0A6C0GF48_9BACT|nr:DUF5522 domain-containing protein [Rhodocytophaga rosea]QHT66290.1 hypothetical protein GXP67_06265 [Rhodocytophaga rosea]
MKKEIKNLENKGLVAEDYYINQQGYIVFTEIYHLKRGYCCKSGCKHCPYGYKTKSAINS